MRPTARTITVCFYEPWLLGWCRWEVVTDLTLGNGKTVCSTLASGRWKWRGRRAPTFEASVNSDIYFAGRAV